MNRQRGMSSLLLVLLILALGSLTLQGVSSLHQSQLSQVTLEVAALKESASAESLLEWGRLSSWRTDTPAQCQQNAAFAGRVCLRLFSDGSLLLLANSGEQTRWQTGALSDGVIQFHRNGWSDFCPRKEVSQCLLP